MSMNKKQIIECYAEWAVNFSNDPYGEIEWLVSKLDEEAFKDIVDVVEMHKSLDDAYDND